MSKKNMSKKKIIAIVSTLVLILGACGWLYYINATNYVATIKGNKITTDEFNFFLGSAKIEMQSKAKVDTKNEAALKAFWDSTFVGEPARDYAKQEALSSAKEFKIQLIKAKEKGLKLDEGNLRDVKSTLDNIKSGMASNTGGDEAGEKKFKKTYNIGYDKYEKILKDLMLVYKYVEVELPTFEVKDAEMEKYYKEKAENVDTVTVRQILFAKMDLTSAEGKEYTEQEIKDKKAKADDVLKKIKAGEDAEKLALTLSDDTSVEEKKGLIEISAKSSLKIEGLKEWALDHKPGDADILDTVYGYFVVKVEKRTTYDDVKDKVKEAVQTQKFLDRLEEWKKDPQFDVVKNDSIYNKMNIK